MMQQAVAHYRLPSEAGSLIARVSWGVAIAGLVIAAVTVGGARESARSIAPNRATTTLATAPAELRSAVMATLGAEKPQGSVRRQGGSLVASGGGVSTVFTRSGAAVRVGGADFGLSLAGVGYGTRLSQIGPATPMTSGNTISYKRATVTEWYRSVPRGIEQGFTLTERPLRKAPGWLTVAIRTSGMLQLSKNGSQITFAGTAGGAALARYGGLAAVDATGRKLPTSLEPQNRTLLLRVDDAGASYPLTIDPLIQQGPKLTPNDATNTGDGIDFGYSVALSADGNTALIGGILDNDQLGAAWVFTRSDGTWSQQGPKLTPNDANLSGEAGAYFGYSVALSADGNTAMIGGILDDAGDGAVWVFTRSGGVWTQQGSKLIPSDVDNDGGGSDFGYSVSLSSDGNTALIGAAADDYGLGAAWVFTRSGGVWSQAGPKLLPSDADNSGGPARFGDAVALSGDGTTAVIGGDFDNSGVGAAWVFTLSGGAWSQQGPKLTANDEDTSHGASYFGDPVAVSTDGNTALIGGDFDGGGLGAAWVFTRSGSTWSQQGPKLTPNDLVGSAFAYSVALSSDGNTALIGGVFDNDGAGAAWVFTRTAGEWSQQGSKLTANDEVGPAELGVKSALSSDGTTALVGGPSDNNGVGAAWVFTPGVDHFKVNLSQSKVFSDSGATVTVRAEDASGHTVTSFAGPVTLSDLSGTLSAGAFTWLDGVGTASVSFTVAFNPDRVIATGGGASGTSGTFDLVGPLDHFLVGSPGSPISAGSNATVRITAQDSLNQTVSDYSGTVTLSDLSHTLSLLGPISWSGGVGTATVSFAAAFNPDRVTATDTLDAVTSSSGTFDLVGPLDHFLVGTPGSSISAGSNATVKITAQDSLNQTVKNYSGTIALTDLSGSLSAGAFTWTNGVTSVPVTFSTPFNPDRVTATALSAPAGSGTSGTFKVTAIPPPKITSFSNLDGGGTLIWCEIGIEIDGSGFTGATNVLFNGHSAVGFNVNSDTQIYAFPPFSAGAGVITVTGPHGTGTDTSTPYTWSDAPCGAV